MATTDIDPCRGTLILENEKFAYDANGKTVVRVANDGFANAIDANNSTTAVLAGGGTFTGIATDVEGYATVAITIFSDQDSALDGLQFQFSTDGTNWDEINKFNLITAESNTRRFQFPVTAKFFRFVYINGATPQTAFRVQTILHRTNILTSIHRIDGELVNDRSVTVVKAVISGETSAGGGGFVNVKVDPAGKLETNASLSGGPAVLNIEWDAFVITDNTLTDVVNYYQGGTGGTVVATFTATYTSSRKTTLVSGVWTYP